MGEGLLESSYLVGLRQGLASMDEFCISGYILIKILALYGFQTSRIFCVNFPSQQAKGASYNLLLLLRKDCLFCHRSECYGPPSPSISLESIKSQDFNFIGSWRRFPVRVEPPLVF